MLRNMLFCAAAALLVTLSTTGDAAAYGVRHVGYTHVGPNGVYHAGRTTAATPYGYHAGGTSYGRSYGGAGGAYHYGATGGYHYGGYGGYGGGYRVGTPPVAYGAGVYRRY